MVIHPPPLPSPFHVENLGKGAVKKEIYEVPLPLGERVRVRGAF
jgi:hypothetical protein